MLVTFPGLSGHVWSLAIVQNGTGSTGEPKIVVGYYDVTVSDYVAEW